MKADLNTIRGNSFQSPIAHTPQVSHWNSWVVKKVLTTRWFAWLCIPFVAVLFVITSTVMLIVFAVPLAIIICDDWSDVYHSHNTGGLMP